MQSDGDCFFFFFNDTATTEIYTLSLHDALPISAARSSGSCSSRRTRTSQQRSAREVERRDRLVASHGRELAKKLVQGLAAFEVIEQRLYRNAGADEHRRAPEDVRVSAHDVA